jgi:hypothetical protein
MKKEVPVWRQSPPCHNTFSLLEVFKVKMFVFIWLFNHKVVRHKKKKQA